MGDVGAGGHGGGNLGTPLGSSSRGGGKWSWRAGIWVIERQSNPSTLSRTLSRALHMTVTTVIAGQVKHISTQNNRRTTVYSTTSAPPRVPDLHTTPIIAPGTTPPVLRRTSLVLKISSFVDTVMNYTLLHTSIHQYQLNIVGDRDSAPTLLHGRDWATQQGGRSRSENLDRWLAGLRGLFVGSVLRPTPNSGQNDD